MNAKRLILSVALALSASVASAQAHGHWHGGFCWPFWSFGVGLSFPLYSYSYPAYAYSYPAYTYTYSQPVFTYSPPANPAPQQPAPAPEPTPAAQASTWVPSTTPTGQWVPDPNPHRYTPEVAPTPPRPPAQSVTLTKSFAGMPVYRVNR